MTKVFLSGKITGDPNYKKKFAAAAKCGYCKDKLVLSPAVLPSELTGNDAMKVCMAMIDVADVVAFLPDFRESPGAMLEYEYCKYTHKPYTYLMLVEKEASA